MKTYLAIVLGVVIAGAGLNLYAEEQPAAAAPAAEKPAATAQSVYVCPDCHTMAMKAGKCSMCGKEMVEKHMLGMKDGKAVVCDCHAGCKCDVAGMKDGKCGCGKVVQTMSAKGMYVCACEGGKCCTAVSDKPGKCACGAEMKKVE